MEERRTNQQCRECCCLQVNSQHNQRTFHFADQTVQNNVWQMFDEEKIPKFKQAKIRTRKAEELYNLTKDKTDYVWYTSRYMRMVAALIICLANTMKLLLLDAIGVVSVLTCERR